MSEIAVRGARLHYELAGKGEPLVLLHEIGGSSESWTDVAAALAKRFTVLRYDQRGTGKSDKIAGNFSLDSQIEDLQALLPALGLQPPYHLAGVALGSAFCIRYATLYPREVRSLVLSCVAMNVDAARKQYLFERAAQVEAQGMAAVVDASLANSYPPAVRRNAATYDAYRARWLANDPKSYAAINRAFVDFDAAPGLTKISCPVLVLAGEHDKLRPPAAVRAVAEQIPKAHYRVIDSGHVMPVQAPVEMAAAMNAFYDQALAGGP